MPPETLHLLPMSDQRDPEDSTAIGRLVATLYFPDCDAYSGGV